MPIKYAELTVIHDKADAGLFSALYEWFGREQYMTPDSTLVFLFDDGEVYDKKGVRPDTQYEFTYLSSRAGLFPAFFKKKSTRMSTYFYKEPIKIDGVMRLDPKGLFQGSTYTNHIPSRYNCIFTCLSRDVFGILRIQSNEYAPRFSIAYESDKFTKEDVMDVSWKLFLGEQ